MKRTVFPKVIAGALALTLLAGGAITLPSGTAQAKDNYCKVPQADWKTIEELKTKLTSEGWDVRKIKKDDGCFEVYAITADGKKIEAYFNPASFELVKLEQEDD